MPSVQEVNVTPFSEARIEGSVSNNVQSLSASIGEEFDTLLQEFNIKTEYHDQLDVLNKIRLLLLRLLSMDVSSRIADDKRSMIATRMVNIVGDISKGLDEKRKISTAEEIDPHSKKFQIVFRWFIDVFYEILVQHDLNSMEIETIFADISSALNGWEDKILSRLKGLPSKELDKIAKKNPFIRTEISE